MTLRFRRSLKIFPGVRLHFGIHGIGVSAGIRGAHVGLHAVTGRPYFSAGLPGTGLYIQQNIGKALNTAPAKKHHHWLFWLAVIWVLVILIGGK